MNIEDYLAKPDQTIKQHSDQLLQCLKTLTDLNYIQNERQLFLTQEACKYHDYGKANEEFQKRVSSKKKRKFDHTKEVPHSILSMYFINPDDYQNEEDYYIIVYAVAFHHVHVNVYDELKKNKDLIKNLLEPFEVNKFRIPFMLSEIDEIRNKKDSILVKGLLHKCDYCASAGVPIEFPNNFLPASLTVLLTSWQQKNASANWNKLQNYCKEKENSNIIAIAATGMGKTEAALHWLGGGKGFFVLPLRTAINAMYNRIRIDILHNENISERLALLHSESAEFLSYQQGIDIEHIPEYNELGRKYSLPLTITTMDQLFDFVFRYSGYELKLATFSYSKIIVDEIQMYNAELLAYLVYGLEQIYAMGGKIAIITATLMPFVRDKLRAKIPFELQTFLSDKKRHNVKVMDEKLNSEDILNLYEKNKNLGKRNKILVICNTIKKAQELYRELENAFDILSLGELHMLHSRYIRMEREQLENEIKDFAGSRKELGTPQNGIWISTSLVEASLDLDFDYLFTELQDLNSVFQRMGRCNRLALKPIDDVNCFVYLQIDSTLLGDFIDSDIYALSKEQLLAFAAEKNETLMTEDDKTNMLEAFSTERLRNSNYMREYKDVYDNLEMLNTGEDNEKQEMRHIQSVEIIPSVIYDEHSERILDLLDALNKESEATERIKLKTEIKKYTLPVPQYIYGKYLRNVSQNKVINRGYIKLSDYEKYPIISCIYTKKGFEALDEVKDAMIW